MIVEIVAADLRLFEMEVAGLDWNFVGAVELAVVELSVVPRLRDLNFGVVPAVALPREMETRYHTSALAACTVFRVVSPCSRCLKG